MPTEITARADQQSDAPDEGDYQAFCEALSASARGRAFLAEYTRRNRNADTEQLLAAIERLQSWVTSNATPPSATVKQELRALLDEIDAAQREFEASVLAIKAGKLAELIALVERRISKILAARGHPEDRRSCTSTRIASRTRSRSRTFTFGCRAAPRTAGIADPFARRCAAAVNCPRAHRDGHGGDYLRRAPA
jgi:hypothetical protein